MIQNQASLSHSESSIGFILLDIFQVIKNTPWIKLSEITTHDVWYPLIKELWRSILSRCLSHQHPHQSTFWVGTLLLVQPPDTVSRKTVWDGASAWAIKAPSKDLDGVCDSWIPKSRFCSQLGNEPTIKRYFSSFSFQSLLLPPLLFSSFSTLHLPPHTICL